MTVTEEMRVAGFNYMSAADCPDAKRLHAKEPVGYLAWHEWAVPDVRLLVRLDAQGRRRQDWRRRVTVHTPSDDKGAEEGAQETAQQAVTALRRVIANDVGGRFAGVEVAAVEQLERRAGGDRRKEGR